MNLRQNIDSPNKIQSMACVLLFISGASGLGYQIVWTRMFAIGVGHEYSSLLAVITAFFGGLSLGAWILDKSIRQSKRPLYYYMALEFLIALWGLVTIFLIPWLNIKMPVWIGLDAHYWRLWLLPFAITLIALLPATIAMGATLPAMESLLAGRTLKKVVGAVYGANTLGAVAGVMGATALLIPCLGYQTTIIILSGFNVLCGFGVLLLKRGEVKETVKVQSASSPKRATRKQKHKRGPVKKQNNTQVPLSRLRILITLFITGLLGIGYEALGVRVMAQVLENTVYSYASVLSIYLLFTAIGASIYQRWLKEKDPAIILNVVCALLSLMVLWGMCILQHSDAIYRSTISRIGGDICGAILGELILALLVFGPATFLMGIVFSHLAQQLRSVGGGLGQAIGINTFGGMLSCFVFGLLLLPVIEAHWSFVVIAISYLAIRMHWRKPSHIVISGVIVFIAFLVPADLHLVHPLKGGIVKVYNEGVMATVSVVTDAAADRYLKVNNQFNMGGTKHTFSERRQGHIPILLHPKAKKVLYLGLGTASTAAAALEHDDLEITAVELLPEIVGLLPEFHAINHKFDQQENVSIHIADARRFVRASQEKYDVIVADLFHPARDGAGLLYTVEHFEAVSERLAKGGLFCQWLPFYQMDEETLQLICRTYLEVFPTGMLWLAQFNLNQPTLGLISSTGTTYTEEWMAQHITTKTLSSQLTACDLNSNAKLFGCLIAGNQALGNWVQPGHLNTDMHPRMVYQAPKYTYLSGRSSFDRGALLLKVLNALKQSSDDIGIQVSSGRLLHQIKNYQKARDIYISAGMDQSRGLFDQAVKKYIETARVSKEFGAGYFMAHMEAIKLLNQGKRREAHKILRGLLSADPEDPGTNRIKRILGIN